ncbi:MAG: penicillin-binding protein 2 [Lentisphaerae bacterium]|nr:penicillin-binding protein 2 [Lentisphaerota bacterium]
MSDRTRIPPDWEVARLRLLFAGMLGAFAVILATLWRIQVAHGEQYREDLAKQSVRRVRIPGPRGLIFDRRGRPLAENRPSYGIALYLEELRPTARRRTTAQEVTRTIEELTAILGVPPQVTTNDLRAHIKRRLPLPYIAWRDLPEEAVARWAERGASMPGVDLYPEPVRVYRAGSNACHVLGYVGRAEIDAGADEPYHYYLSEMAGAAGIEKVYDDVLRGQAGGRLVRVDAAGFRYHDLGGTEARPGQDLKLSLDLDLQRAAEAALAGIPGALVALDPDTGAVLAMASTPAYDPNGFVPSIPSSLWTALRDDPLTPLLNRAAAGAYAPGSTFKPVVAMAAMQSRKASASTRHTCPGYFQLGSARFRCWDTLGHDTIDLSHAIRYSCNVYFFHLGLDTGPDPIAATARAIGLGGRSGIDLDAESPGIVPDPAWKRRAWRDTWRDGDTCNYAIGQGPIATTPLQMAMVAASIANGGKRVHPRLLMAVRPHGADAFRDAPGEAPESLGWNAAALRVVREGMRDVVMAEDGTGRRLRVPGVALAGKTGTAEYGRKEEGKKRGWMIAFGPFEKPRVAVAMVVEDAVSGGLTVAPRLQQFFAAAFGAGTNAAPAGGQG